jgi:hypothetical protein
MLLKALQTFSVILSSHLQRTFRLDGDVVVLQPVTNTVQASPTNKVHVFPVNIERETAGGISFNRQPVSGEHFKQTAAAWPLNIYVMIAAVFSEKQYGEGLQLLSGVAAFLQTNNSFRLLQPDVNISIEPVNLSLHELSNVWSICGGMYHPSFLCKMRNITIDGNEIQQMGKLIKSSDGQLDKL